MRRATSQTHGKCLVIPRFFPIKRIQEFLPDQKVVEYHTDHYIQPRFVDIGCHAEPRDDIQRNAQRFLKAEDEFSRNAHINMKRLALQTGKGKTYSLIKFASDMGVLPIIFVHRQTFVERWIKEGFEKFTTTTRDDIAVISGKDSLLKVMKHPEKYKAIIAMHRTFGNLLQESDGTKLVRQFFKVMRPGIKSYDEAHLEQKAVFHIDAVTDVWMTIDLSATFKKTARSAHRILSYMTPEYVSFGDDIEDKRERFHNVIFCKINSHPSQQAIYATSRRRGFDAVAYAKHVEESSYDLLMATVCSFIHKLHSNNPKIQIAITVGSLPLAKQFHEDMTNYYPDHSIGQFTSIIKKIPKRLLELEKDIIITTEKSFMAGEDCGVEVIINTVPIGGEGGIEQLVGRLRGGENKKALFIDITDVGFEKSYNQFSLRKKFIETELAATSTLVDLTASKVS
jgi:hypothetical protein